MAIKRKRPSDFKPTAVKEFTDRVEPRKAFWDRYQKMAAEGSTLITFYGAGGVGKTALLKKLESEIKSRDAITGKECKYVQYDFSISTELREVLKTFKFQLSNYGCTFPLFDAGNYYFSLKTGQDITPLKARSMLEKIPWLNVIRGKLEQANAIAGQASPILTTAKTFFAATDDVLKTFPLMKTITTCFSIVDTMLVKYMEMTETLDDDHAEIRRQLNARSQEKNPVALYEYLPTLFAQDVADWMQATDNKLVMLLDNYESLISATALATEEQLKRDLWLRGDEGLIFMIPDTLWTIAGRNKLRWDGELADELEQHLIKALSPEDSNWFLQRAGIADENLRGELVKLTEGYPIFLDLCVDVYFEYKQRHGTEPTIDAFGQKRQDVVARIFRYLDADKDDAAKDMLEFLCVLNVWTDELAVDIGGRVLHNFSRNTYKRVKEFTFIQEERVANDDLDLTLYRFDKTIQSIIIATCDEKLISDVKRGTNDYFQKFFAENKIFDSKNIFYLKLWTELVVRLTDDADELSKQFDDAIKDIFDELFVIANYNTAEEILNLFMSRIETLNGTDNISYAAFEFQLSDLKQFQAKFEEAYAFANSAYEKFSRLLGEKHNDTINAMSNLAVTLNCLGRYDEALTLNEKVLELRKETHDDNHPDTINALEALATTLSDLGRYNEALQLNEQVLTLRKELLGDKHIHTINAMHNLAVVFDDLGRYDEALQLNEQVLELRKEVLGDDHPDTIAIMQNLAVTLNELERFDEALTLNEKILALMKNLYGDEHLETILVMHNLAVSLDCLERYEEALTLEEKVLSTLRELLGNNHPGISNAMQSLAITLENLGRLDEALTLKNEVLSLRKESLGDKHPETISAMGNVAWTLVKMERYDEAAQIQREVLALTEEVLDERHPRHLLAISNLAYTLDNMDRHDEALPLREKILALDKEIFGDNHPATINETCNLAMTLNSLNRRDEALQLIEQALNAAKESFGDDDPYTQEILDLREKILHGDD